jgi:hypothetical protein
VGKLQNSSNGTSSSKVPLVTNWPWPKIPVAGMDDWGRSEVKKMGETMGKSQLLMMITMERWLFMPLLWWDNQWKIMVKHGSLIDY